MVESYPALAVPEVLLEIFETLSSKDLFRMALTCKDWTELALETLWRTAQIKLSHLLLTVAPLTEALHGATAVSMHSDLELADDSLMPL